MDGGSGAKTIVYNMKRDSKKRKRGKEKQEKSKRLKKYNSKKKEFHIIDHTIRAYPKMLFVLVYV